MINYKTQNEISVTFLQMATLLVITNTYISIVQDSCVSDRVLKGATHERDQHRQIPCSSPQLTFRHDIGKADLIRATKAYSD